MAYASIYANSAYSVTGSINDLQYSAENYNQFTFRLCYDNGVNWIQIDSYTVLGGDVWGQYSVSHTFSASPNTRYCVFVDVYHSSGTYTFQSGGVYTPQVYSTPGLPTNVNTSVGYTTATITFIQGSGAYYTNMDASWGGYTIDYVTSGTSFSISGLSEGTTYSFRLQSERSQAEGGLQSSWSGWYSFTTASHPVYPAPDLPSNVNISASTTGATITFIQGSGAYYTNMDASWLGGTNDYVTSGTSFNITGLTANTSYSFKLQSERSSSENSVKSNWSSSYYFTTPSARPSNFAWTTSISTGSNIASTDLVNKILYPIRATEWNAFTSKINAFRTYKGLSNYNFTSVGSGTNFTSTIVNQAITAINAMNPSTSTPTCDTTTNVCSAYLYQRLRDSLNSIP
jgi:hypothetical protein